MSTEAGHLLDDLGNLRRRTRRDSHAYWLPFLLFGVSIVIAPLVYQASPAPPGGSFPLPVIHIGGLRTDPLGMFSSVGLFGDPTTIGLYWLGVVVIGTLITLAWYRWRAVRVGLQPRTGIYLLYVLAGIVVCVVPLPLLVGLLGMSNGGVWFGAGVFVLGAIVGTLCSRGRSVGMRIGLVAGVLLMLLAANQVAFVASIQGYAGLLVIAAGMIGLAWMERSALCTTVAVLFTAAALLTNLYTLTNLFAVTALSSSALLVTFVDLVLPALVLLAGGVMALVVGRRTA